MPVLLLAAGEGLTLYEIGQLRSTATSVSFAAASAGANMLHNGKPDSDAIAAAQSIIAANGGSFAPGTTIAPPTVTVANGQISVTIGVSKVPLWPLFQDTIGATASATS